MGVRVRPRLVGAAAFVLVLLAMSLPSGTSHAGGDPAIPRELGGYSHVTGDVSGSPPGRAVALFQHGFGVEFLDHPQAVVLGAGGDVYRRLDVAEDRAGPETQGDPAPMLLSPDGLSVAVGDHDLATADLAVVDLRTGDTTYHELSEGRSVHPLAWSPDARTIAYRTSARPTNPYSSRGPRGGSLGLLDLGTGKVTAVPGGSDVVAAAFSPDGTELALQRTRGGERLEVVGVDGRRMRVLGADGALAGQDAWSPDGRLLALVRRSTGPPGDIVFVDPSGRPGPVPDRVPGGDFLGWAGPDEVTVLVDSTPRPGARHPEHAVVKAVPLGAPSRQLMRMGDLDSYGVGSFQLAAGLLTDLRVVTPTDADRGVWPWPFRIAVALVAGLLAVLLAVLLRRGIQRWTGSAPAPA